MKLFKLFIINLLTKGLSENFEHEGRDEHGCIITKGYSWCNDLQSCIRMWETPCYDYFEDCENCLFRRTMENIACPLDCISGIHNEDNGNNIITPSCGLCPPPPPCPQPGPDCNYIPPMVDRCGCTYDCGMISCRQGEDILPDPIEDCPIDQIDCINEFVCPKVTEITHCNEGGIRGYTTYQLSLVIQPNKQIKNIYALFGEGGNHLMYFPPANQIDGPFNSNLGGIPQDIINLDWDLIYDSWITIGITNGDKNNELSTIGIDFNQWSNTQSISTTNGAVFSMDPENVLSKNEYTIAQLTVPNNRISTFSANVQGRKIDGGSWKEYNINFVLDPSKLSKNIIPPHCLIWYDGCNLCNVNNGEIILCTENMCLIDGNPECRVYDDQNSGH